MSVETVSIIRGTWLYINEFTWERNYKYEQYLEKNGDQMVLKIHMGTHTDKKAFKCEKCGKIFGQMKYFVDLMCLILRHCRLEMIKCDSSYIFLIN